MGNLAEFVACVLLQKKTKSKQTKKNQLITIQNQSTATASFHVKK